MREETPERLRRAARAMLYAVNRGTFEGSAAFPEDDALRLVIDLQELADELGERRAERWVRAGRQAPARGPSFFLRVLRLP
ncbi:MAG: hypothetical protein M0002_03285 [Rhodospirillales bacterium]|nr:hypothetical protein [Rhodospirillales bacterium]